MTSVLGGRDTVITGLSVGEGEKGKGMERVRREGREREE